jgi:hypothetical protein
MTNPRPINFHESGAGTAATSARIAKKIIVLILAALTVSSMIAWCGLLGWGVVELLQLAATTIYRLWTGSL